MSKKITLNKSEMIKFVSMIVEEVNVKDYSDEDFIEVFVNYFRAWIKEKHGDEIGEYPMSYLFKKYVKEFESDLELSSERNGYGTLHQLSKLGKELVLKGKKTLPNLGKTEFFTQRFKKHLDFFISNLNIPDFITINIKEDRPYDIKITYDVDFLKLIHSQGVDLSVIDLNTYTQGIINFISTTLGFELGSPAHGKLRIDSNNDGNFIGYTEWYENILPKLKKIVKLKAQKDGRFIHSFKFDRRRYSLSFYLGAVFPRGTSYPIMVSIIEDANTLLSDLGYNTTALEVTRY
jgi:hypothetical protein